LLAVPPAIHPVSGSDADSQFHHALANRLPVSQVSIFDLCKPKDDSSFRHLVSDRRDPLSERVSSVGFPVVEELNHE
jgi:hypothetical protein